MTDQTITLTLKADASGMVKVVGSAVDGVKTKLAQAGSATDAWKRQLGQIGNVGKAAFVALTAAAAAAGAGMALMVRSSINAADAIYEASQRTGVAAEQLSQLKFAAEQSGTSFEAVEKALTKLAREADAGGENLARLGVSAVDSSGKMRPVNDVFAEVADRFSQMGSASEKSAAAQAIFGKGAAELVPLLSEGSAGLAAMGDEAERLGVVISGDTASAAAAFNDNLDKLSAAGSGLANSLMTALMPTLVDLSTRAVEWAQSLIAAERQTGFFQDSVEAMATGLKVGLLALVLVKNALDAFITTVIGAVDIVATSFGAIGRIVGTVATSIRDALAAAFDLDAAGVKDAIGGVGAKVEGILNEATTRIAASGGAVAAAWDESIGDVTNTIDTLFSKYEDGAAASAKLTTATDEATDATRSLGAASKVTAEAEKLRVEALKNLQAGMEKLAGITQDYERQLAGPVQQAMIDYEAAQQAIATAADEALAALTALGGGVEAQAQVYAAEERALDLAAQAHERLTRAAEVEMANRTQFASVADAGLADLREETRQLQLTHVERVTEAALLTASTQAQQDYIDKKRETIGLSAAEIAAIRAGAAAQVEGQNQIIAAQDAAGESQSTLISGVGNLSTAVADFALGGIKSFKDFGDAALNIARQTLADIIAMFLRNKILISVGMGGSGVSGLAAAGTGQAGALAGGGGLLGGGVGGLLGSIGGLLGGTGTGFGTGLLASGSIFSGAGLLGGITGSISAGVSSILGGSIMQGVGMLAGPIGLIVGAVSLLTSVIKRDKPPDFRVGGTNGRVRGVEGNFDTVFGQVNAGSRQISWESLVEPMQQFDAGIQQLVATLGGGQPQIDAIRDTLSRWVVDLRGNAATAENVLGSRFSAILTTFSADVQQFVGGAGTIQERIAKLTDALAIEKIVDTGALGETFAEVSALITEYRTGTEAIADTYGRVLGSVMLLDEALAISGTSLDLTRAEMIRFATDITEAAGGLERAQSLWSAYFETFYTADERAAYALQQAQANAATQAGDIGLNASDFAGAAGAQQFRDLFETMLPTLSAEAVVQWLEFAQALGVVLDLTGEVSEAVTETAAQVSTSLTDLMSSVTEQLEQYAPPQTFAQRLQAINVETDTMIAQARALGATEEQLGQIRALSAARLGEVLDEQAAAMQNYQSVVQGINDELADARGLSEFQREMREIDRTLASNIASMNEAARAAGMQGAAESDLAAAHELAAIRAAQAIARLEERGRSVVQQLYGSPLERLNEQIAEIEAGISGFAGGVSGGMEQVTQATDSAVQAQLGAQQRIRDWLDNLMLGDLGGLKPRDALVEAQALFDRTLAGALGGDADAMAALPGLADQLLRLGQRVYASGDPYFDLRDTIREALTQVAGIVTENPLPVGGGGGGNGGGGTVGNGGGGDATALYAERDRLIAEQRAAERLDLARELTGYIRDIVTATSRPLDEIETTLGFSMVDLVTDLGVNLQSLTDATATQLGDIAQATGTELTDLAASVGVDLGSLADRQSLLNNALESEIAGLPQQQRDQLAPLLQRVEDAAALGDTAGVEAGIGDMETAINEMAPDIRDALAPYFAGIRPVDPVTEIGHLSSIDTILADSRGQLEAQTGLLTSIYDVLANPAAPSPPDGPLVPGGGFPKYATGTGYVPTDGLAYLHRGESVFPASVSEFFRREGIPIRPMPVLGGASGGQSGAGTDALLAELRAMSRKLDEGNADRRRMEQRIQQLEGATRDAGNKQQSAIERQTDAIKAGKR